MVSRASVLVAASALLCASTAYGAEIKVMISGGFTAAYRDLTPEFERMTKHTVATARGASMGTAPDSIPSRLQRGESVDALIMVEEAFDGLIKQGKVVGGSRVDLARSKIGMAVRAGAPKPDISSVDAFKRTLLDAKSVAYSDSASGVYISTVLFPRLGITDQMMGKSKRLPGESIGASVARGDAELGFLPISELLPVQGIDYVGPLPPEIQKVTIYSAGIAVGAKEPDAARALLEFLASPAAAAAITRSGLEPAAAK
jgi:molybdate transport system substrate-binding protein